MLVKNSYESGETKEFIQNFFVVDYCDVIAYNVGYYDPNCETNHTLVNQIMERYYATIRTKTVVRFFDSKKFKDNYFEEG